MRDDENDAGQCYCGYKATVHQDGLYFWVQCNRPDCWISPVLKRRDKVIKAWKKIMQRSEDGDI